MVCISLDDIDIMGTSSDTDEYGQWRHSRYVFAPLQHLLQPPFLPWQICKANKA